MTLLDMMLKLLFVLIHEFTEMSTFMIDCRFEVIMLSIMFTSIQHPCVLAH